MLSNRLDNRRLTVRKCSSCTRPAAAEFEFLLIRSGHSWGGTLESLKLPIHRLMTLLVFGLLLCGLAGCAAQLPQTAEAPGSASPSSATLGGVQGPQPIRLQPGDQIEIKFAYAEQFNETQTIRPDGMIALQLIGEVAAAGKTLPELRDTLMHRYAVELKHPELVVIARSFYDRRVYVGGAVKTPGMVEMPAPLTVLEAIIHAGGFDLDQADSEQVVVIRQSGGSRRNFLVNVKDQIHAPSVQSFVLEPRDIVYVSRTRISDVDLWVQQHLYKILPPFTFTVGYSF